MKRILYLFMIFAVSTLLSSCSKGSAFEKLPVEPFEINEEICLEKSIFNIENESISQPEKIASDGESLFICDSGNDRILICDLNGKNARSIGSLGSGHCEFVKPQIVSVNSDKLCVYDSGNKRIQLLTKEGEYLSEYSLDDLGALSNLVDMKIDSNDNIYFSVIAYNDSLDRSGIYTIQNDDFTHIKPYAVSNMCFDNENKCLYYISKYELETKLSWTTGYCEFGKISNNVLEFQKGISDLYSSLDMFYYDNSIYVYNYTLQNIDKFDTSGNYQATIFSESAKNEFGYSGFCSDNKGNFYLSDKKNNTIFKLSSINGENK